MKNLVSGKEIFEGKKMSSVYENYELTKGGRFTRELLRFKKKRNHLLLTLKMYNNIKL